MVVATSGTVKSVRVDMKIDGAKYNPERKSVGGCRRLETGGELHASARQHIARAPMDGVDQSIVMC